MGGVMSGELQNVPGARLADVAAGQEISAQFWTRNPGATFGVGLTDAIEFLVCP